MYRILSLDGGGIRGLLTLVILERLEQAMPGWVGRCQLIAGTSTGGIIALGLAAGLSPAALIRLYTGRCRQIFADNPVDDLLDLGKLIGADYSHRPLESALRETLGDIRLKELNTRVLVAAFDLDGDDPDPLRRRWKAKFFHNYPGSDSDGEALAGRVALYTALAPTYFPAVDGFIDGGVVAANPSVAAIAQTQDPRADIPDRPALGDLALLSLGTGAPRHLVEGRMLDWGYIQWARPLLEIVLDGSIGLADYQAHQLLRERYHRISPLLGQVIEMDDCDAMETLIQIGRQQNIRPALAWLRHYWMG
jgi:hypothetical protein